MDKITKVEIVRNDGERFVVGLFGLGLSNWCFYNGGLSGFGSFDKDIEYVDSAISDGGSIVSARLSKKDRTVECAWIDLPTNDIARRSMTKFFAVHDSYKVYVTYAGRTYWREAELYKFKPSEETNIENTLLTVSLTFLFENPLWKSYDDFGKDIASRTASWGLPYCVKNYGALKGFAPTVLDFSQKVSLLNDGDVSTPARIVITFSGVVIAPKIVVNDSMVRMEDSYVSGDILEMDFTQNPPTIKKNGENHLGYADKKSDFDSMQLRRGDNTISYDADNGSNLMSVSVYYNKLYGAI